MRNYYSILKPMFHILNNRKLDYWKQKHLFIALREKRESLIKIIIEKKKDDQLNYGKFNYTFLISIEHNTSGTLCAEVRRYESFNMKIQNGSKKRVLFQKIIVIHKGEKIKSRKGCFCPTIEKVDQLVFLF